MLEPCCCAKTYMIVWAELQITHVTNRPILEAVVIDPDIVLKNESSDPLQPCYYEYNITRI